MFLILKSPRKLWSISILLIFLPTYTVTAEDFEFHHESILGTSMSLIVDAPNEEAAKVAERAALDEIDRLRAILSIYDPQSEVSQFSTFALGSPRYVSEELLEVLVACDWWKAKTNGAFNLLTAELPKLWKAGEVSNSIPSQDQINNILESIAKPAWKVDASYEMVQRILPLAVSLDAIAKRYIPDHTCEVAMESSDNINGVLLDIGGDITVRGSIDRFIGVTNPATPEDNAPVLLTLQLWDHSVATSANYARGFNIQGNQYSHIIDPRNGYPVNGDVVSATVISNSATQADALSTALMIFSPEEGLEIINSLPSTDCLLVCKDGSQRRSSQFDTFVYEKVERATSPTTWKEARVLEVNFEINRPQGGRRYHRPYVAIWIEDNKGKCVKTLCLWLERSSKWVQKLSRWSRLRNLDPGTMRTVTRATRMPGQYSLI